MFDARAAKALLPGNHLTVEGAPGLRLTATQTLRTWSYRFRSPVDDRIRQIKLGHWPAMGLPAALAAWERVKKLRQAGSDPAAEKRERRRKVAADSRETGCTVRKAADDFLSSYSGTVAPKTYEEARRLLAGELAPIESKPTASVTRADAFDLLDAMRERPVLAQRLRNLLGSVWDRAIDSGRVPDDAVNWWRLVLKGKLVSKGKMVRGKRVKTKRVLSEDELVLLIPWLPNLSRDMEDILVMYLWTCARGAEICAIEAVDVSEEADGWWWTVPIAKLKMRRIDSITDLRVPLVGRALVIVKRRMGAHPEGFLFPTDGASGHIEQKAVGAAVWHHRPGCKNRPHVVRSRFPIADFAAHDLRRTGRTMLSAMGCPTDVAEAIIGHVQPGIQGTYNVHKYDAERRVWITRLAEKLGALARGNVTLAA